MKNINNWKKELARDFLALGSWVFFVLTFVRIIILPERWPYINHLIVAGIFILLIDLFLRGKTDTYVSKALAIGYFTILIYENNLFTGFVGLALLGMLWSSYYVGNDWKKTGWGIVIGVVGVGLGFLVNSWIG